MFSYTIQYIYIYICLAGSFAEADDIAKFESVGLSHHVMAAGLSLLSGHLHFMSVKGSTTSQSDYYLIHIYLFNFFTQYFHFSL